MANNGGASKTKLVTAAVTFVVAAVLAMAGVNVGGLGSGSGNSSQVGREQSATSSTSSKSSASTSAASADTSDAPAEQVEAAKAGELTFRYADRLREHYYKHGREMGFSSAGDYLAAANAVVANDQALHKLESEDGDDVYYLESTGEFVVVSSRNYIRTYYTADKDYFERQ